VLEPIHNRMPVIVRREDWEEWFSPGELADDVFQRIITPYKAEEMSALAVSSVVNSAKIDDVRCCNAWDWEAVPQKLVVTRSARDDQERQRVWGFDQ
jgi:putative SOS response-associated peptidase YedK